MLVGCIKQTKTVMNSDGNKYEVPSCVYTNSCVGGGGTTGGLPGSTTGTSTGTTTGTSTGSSSGGDWTNIYPGGVPTGTCSSPTGNGYAPRTAILTSSGELDYYVPSNPITLNYVSTDQSLKTEAGALALFSADSVVKLRLKALAEPPSAGTDERICYRRQKGSPGLGYTKMILWGSIIGVRADGSKGSHPLHPSGIEFSVNHCTPAIDMSPYKAMYPGGLYIQINQVKVNEGHGTSWSSYGIPKTKCWSIQFEIATDSTQTFQ